MSTEIKRFQCRHIFTDGRRCGSPSLRQEEFCYHHHTTRKPIANLAKRRQTQALAEDRAAAFDLPEPEDRSAIQLSIGEVLRRIASNNIDPRRAGLLLYGLQIASLNLPRQKQAEAPPTGELVEEIVVHPTHGNLAPVADFTNPTGEKTLEDILNEQWDREQVLTMVQATATPTPGGSTREKAPHGSGALASTQTELDSLTMTRNTRTRHASNQNRQPKEHTRNHARRNKVIPIKRNRGRIAGRKPRQRVRIHIPHPNHKVAQHKERRSRSHNACRHTQHRSAPQNLMPHQADTRIPGPRNQITGNMKSVVIGIGREAEVRNHQRRNCHSTLPPRPPCPKEQQAPANRSEIQGGHMKNRRKKAA
jgi:hypothetical protein